MLKNITRYWLLATAALLVLVSSCTKDFPENVESPDEVVLKSIRIVNAGANGNDVVQGVIDENRKTISFPRLDTLTDFSKIKFEGEMSNGAAFDQPTYAFEFAEGEAAKTQVIKIVNKKRFREYLVTLRLLIPVFGADWGKAEIFDYTNNALGNPIYPGFVSQNTRGTGFDGEHVLIVQRSSLSTGTPHLLRVSDLKQYNISPINLNQTGMSGGTIYASMGAVVKGHIYISNVGNPLKIYHWTDPTAAPELIANLPYNTIPEIGVRHGDNMSVNLDENGNGFMYFGENSPFSKILRLQVSNYTTISNPTVLLNATGSNFTMSFNRVGNTDDYIYTGHEAPIRVANESAIISYALSNTAVPIRGSDARVFTFNEERYLIMTTAARTGQEATVLYVYDITKGDNTVEALKLFNEKADKSPVFQYSLLGAVNGAPMTQTGFYITKDNEGKDDKLTLYTASTDAGFVIIDFPKKTLTD